MVSLGRLWAVLVPRWADRNLRIVLGARVAMSVGRAVAAVVTALYLAEIGFSAVSIGLFFVAVTLAAAAISTGIGLLADHFGRRRFLVAIPLMTATSAAVFSETRVAAVLFVAGALGTFGRGSDAVGGSVGPYTPAEAALVADVVGGERRAVAFSRLVFASTFGALIGGLVASVVRTSPHMTPEAATVAYRPAFLLAAGFALVAGLLALGIKEPERPHTHGDGRGKDHAVPGARPAARRLRWPKRSWPALWRFFTTNATNGLAIGLVGPFMSYWLFRRYGATPGEIGVLFSVVSLASLLSILVSAPVGRTLGTVRAIVIARAVSGALLVPMVLSPAFAIAGAVYLVRMMVQRVGLPLRQSFTQDMAHPEERASVAALSNLPSQATMAAGQVTAGYLFDEVSLALPFELAALFQLVNAGLYGYLFSVRPPRSAHDGASEPAAVDAPAPSPEQGPAAEPIGPR